LDHSREVIQMMRRMSEVADRLLAWEPVGARNLELRSGGEVLATLRWANACGSLATGEAAEGRWTFKRVGFFRTRITVRSAGTDFEIAEMTATERRKLLAFSDGSSCRWGRVARGSRESAFFDDADRPLVRFSGRRSHPTPRINVAIEPAGAASGELSLLVLIGAYRLVLEHEDEEAAVMAASLAAVTS
jgi:hypothetical protein